MPQKRIFFFESKNRLEVVYFKVKTESQIFKQKTNPMNIHKLFFLVSLIAITAFAQTVDISATATFTITEGNQVAHRGSVVVTATGPEIGKTGTYSGNYKFSIDNNPAIPVNAQLIVSSNSVNYVSNDANENTLYQELKQLVNSDQQLSQFVKNVSQIPIIQELIGQASSNTNIQVSITDQIKNIIYNHQNEYGIQVGFGDNEITIQSPTIDNTSIFIKIMYAITPTSTGANLAGSNNARTSSAGTITGAGIAFSLIAAALSSL